MITLSRKHDNYIVTIRLTIHWKNEHRLQKNVGQKDVYCICAVLKSNWLFHVNPFKTESCNECPHGSWQQIWKGQAKKPTTRLFDLCLYRQSVIGVEHSNSDSFTLLVNWIRWCLIELSPKRTCHGPLALLGPHGDAISTRLDASLTKTEEATRVEFKSSGSLKK